MSASELLRRLDPHVLAITEGGHDVYGQAVAAAVDEQATITASEREDIVSYVESIEGMLDDGDWRCPYIGFGEDYKAFLRLKVA